MSYLDPLPVFDGASHFIINTMNLTPQDLSLFIESLETISHLERLRHCGRLKDKIATVREFIDEAQQEPIYAVVYNETEISTKSNDEPVMQLEMKKIRDCPGSSILKLDENYHSSTGEAQYSARASIAYTKSNVFATSKCHLPACDSGASGVGKFPSHEQPIRPRSKVIIESEYGGARSRIIALMLKREYALKDRKKVLQQQRNDNIFDIVWAYEAEVKRHNRVLNEIINRQYDTIKKNKKMSDKNKRGPAVGDFDSSPENRFWDKAMSYLKL